MYPIPATGEAIQFPGPDLSASFKNCDLVLQRSIYYDSERFISNFTNLSTICQFSAISARGEKARAIILRSGYSHGYEEKDY